MSKVKILFVDDEQNILNSFRLTMRSMRDVWDVAFAPGGHEALDLMKTQTFDVIVSDMRMPRMDGAQLLAEVAKRSPETVRMVLSGYSDQGTVLRAVKLAHQYLSKPCTPEELKGAITRSLHLRDIIHSSTIKQIVARIEALPALPKLYQELMEALQDTNSSLQYIGDIISQDVAMSSSILRLVNSAFFGLPTHVSSVGHAVKLLGVETIRALVLSIELFCDSKSEIPGGLSLQKLWSHSIRVSCFCKTITEYEKQPKEMRDDCFIAGTLHDLGTLVLATSLPDEYGQLVERCRTAHTPLHIIEKEVFGTTHAEVGAYLLSLWGFKDCITEAVCWHHEPEHIGCTHFSPLLAVYAANFFDNDLGSVIPESVCIEQELPCTGNEHLITKIQEWQNLCAEMMERCGKE